MRTAARGVDIRVIVPGASTDQRWVRLASRRMYGQLLEAGVRIFEYDAGMTHVKALLVDDLWAVIGTTNFDNRSFEHNDEVNVAVRDRGGGGAADRRFRSATSRKSREITLDDWRSAGRCGKSSSARSPGFSSDSSSRVTISQVLVRQTSDFLTF